MWRELTCEAEQQRVRNCRCVALSTCSAKTARVAPLRRRRRRSASCGSKALSRRLKWRYRIWNRSLSPTSSGAASQVESGQILSLRSTHLPSASRWLASLSLSCRRRASTVGRRKLRRRSAAQRSQGTAESGCSAAHWSSAAMKCGDEFAATVEALQRLLLTAIEVLSSLCGRVRTAQLAACLLNIRRSGLLLAQIWIDQRKPRGPCERGERRTPTDWPRVVGWCL